MEFDIDLIKWTCWYFSSPFLRFLVHSQKFIQSIDPWYIYRYPKFKMSKIAELERDLLKWSSTSISSGLVDISVHSSDFSFTLKFKDKTEKTFPCDSEADRQTYVRSHLRSNSLSLYSPIVLSLLGYFRFCPRKKKKKKKKKKTWRKRTRRRGGLRRWGRRIRFDPWSWCWRSGQINARRILVS